MAASSLRRYALEGELDQVRTERDRLAELLEDFEKRHAAALEDHGRALRRSSALKSEVTPWLPLVDYSSFGGGPNSSHHGPSVPPEIFLRWRELQAIEESAEDLQRTVNGYGERVRVCREYLRRAETRVRDLEAELAAAAA